MPAAGKYRNDMLINKICVQVGSLPPGPYIMRLTGRGRTGRLVYADKAVALQCGK